MFSGWPEHCNTEGTFSEYSWNIPGIFLDILTDFSDATCLFFTSSSINDLLSIKTLKSLNSTNGF